MRKFLMIIFSVMLIFCITACAAENNAEKTVL